MTILAPEIETVDRMQALRVEGRVTVLRGMTMLVRDLPMPVGSMVRIDGRDGPVPGEVVGFGEGSTIVMTLGQIGGIRIGDRVEGTQATQTVRVGPRMLGRCLNALAQPIDEKGPIHEGVTRPLSPSPVSALSRRRIDQAISTGVRAIDLMTTIGRGQRMGIFAGPGVGKSTLLGWIARATDADVNVIALIGERGREVREFIEDALGPEGLARSVVIIATGDESPLLRIRAAKLACTVSEYFRECGRDVLMMMDSVTRFAHAQRQIGLSVGEPPATRGYTPSVFTEMATLLERAGAVEGGGSITGLYTILVEGDDMTEPVSDAARGILDGHLMLSRRLAQRAHYPAIDVLDSVSRIADHICSSDHIEARQIVRRLMARYAEVEDLVQIGAYAKGSHVESDAAIDLHDEVNRMLRQRVGESAEGGLASMIALGATAKARLGAS